MLCQTGKHTTTVTPHLFIPRGRMSPLEGVLHCDMHRMKSRKLLIELIDGAQMWKTHS